MKKCVICKGAVKHKKVDIPVELKNNLLMIRDVPADVCEECGEIYYTLEVARKLESIEDKVMCGTLKPSPMKNAYELPLTA
jgi:YgiT-type zinc finger domain-containing protein